jgi:hypothetical protein
MSYALKYSPVYLGLLAAQILAVTCNAFLDIQYGVFATEVFLWSVAFALTLWIGWLQKGEASEGGKIWMRRVLIFGILLSVVIFIPMWGFPRAGLYMLATMLVSYNCVTTTRRHLHLSLLITLVMVLFATSHYRADWTMLFYLVPYVVAVVFTLVAEQVNRKADELRQQSIRQQMVGAQGVAIAAATAVILLLGSLFYALTPQVNWFSLMWDSGQPTAITQGEGKLQTGMQQGGGGGSGGAGGQASGSSGRASPFPGEMRQAAKRKGMPEWQRDAINSMADMAEKLEQVMEPVMQSMRELWNEIKKWIEKNRENIILALIIIGALALLYAMWRLMREAKVTTWLRTRYDYFFIVQLKAFNADVQGACKHYEAMVRLFELQDLGRGSRRNTHEYEAEINVYFRHLHRETGELTRLYEDARYGNRIGPVQVGRMRELYRVIFKDLAENY